ncbi:MAG TPA: EamA family transporter, partial [Candidatus Nanoarchaeia archaeon]|nr:EamA family transporter [Candidatus Nanoarchaeia archaeon]
YSFSAMLLILPTTLMISDLAIPKSSATIISILLLGGIMNSIAFVFWFKALQSGNTHKTANIIYIVPFLAMVWTYALNAEPFSFHSIIGLGLIIVGIFIQLRNKT